MRPARAALGVLAVLALGACCPPGVSTGALEAFQPARQAAAAQGGAPTAVAAGRGYGFALLGQAGGAAQGEAGAAQGERSAAQGAGDPRTGAGEPETGGAPAALLARFESAWRLVDERYWDLGSLGVDWDEVGERYRARLAGVTDEADLYALLEQMYDELGDNHSVYVPPARVAEIRKAYGDLPCVAVFDSAASRTPPLPLAWTRSQSPSSLATDAAGPVAYGLTAAGDLQVGYVRLPDLASDGVAGGLRAAVERLSRAGAEAFVLDLRGNPGGRLVTMMQAAGVFTRGFLWRAVMSWTLPLPYPAIGEPVTSLPLVVLIDGDVNSAAEGLAGALQANGRAYLIGETTAGNVEAVLPFCLRDGSQAWIATGVLAPLLGATWEGSGVKPDLEVASDDALTRALDYLAAGTGADSGR